MQLTPTQDAAFLHIYKSGAPISMLGISKEMKWDKVLAKNILSQLVSMELLTSYSNGQYVTCQKGRDLYQERFSPRTVKQERKRKDKATQARSEAKQVTEPKPEKQPVQEMALNGYGPAAELVTSYNEQVPIDSARGMAELIAQEQILAPPTPAYNTDNNPNQHPALAAIDELERKLTGCTAPVQELELKKQVLIRLGAILADDIRAVLLEIADDLDR